jgi:Tol biopolymer transport system component
MYGYTQSPLYVANIDYSAMDEIFSVPNVAPINAQWSPDGEWIAFTGVGFEDDMFTESDRCVWLTKLNGDAFVVKCITANFLTWSPDGEHFLYSQQLGAQENMHIFDLATSSRRTKLPFQADPDTHIDWGRLP